MTGRILIHDAEHRSGRRYSAAVMAYARELHANGWAPTRIAAAIAREHGIDAMPDVNTIKAWVDPDWCTRRRASSAAADRRWRARKKKAGQP